MDLNNLILAFLLILFSLFFYKYFLLRINKYNSKFLIDDQFSKPQAFHHKAVSISGGTCLFFSLLIVFVYFWLFKKIIFLEYISICIFFFVLGFIDDVRINTKPTIRLVLMIVFLITLIKFNEFYVDKTGLEVLDGWLKNSKTFSLIFICLCFLFIINGANLIDGYNGLLGIHALIILVNLFLINYLNGNIDLSTLLFFAIIILLTFLLFNFPKAKIFLGDSGSYLLGTFIAISVIKTSIANPNISPFYFCILLFYLFFEVFFSFFRKLIREKSSPVHPDGKHLHMLLYKLLVKKNKNKLKSNYYTSVIINLIYLLFIIPPILMMDDGFFCKYYSVILFIFYFYCYKLANERVK